MSDTAYLDSVIDDPATLATQLRKEMEKGIGEDQLSEEERKELDAALAPPAPRLSHRSTSFTLRGEGGSGELPRSVETEMRLGTDPYGRDLNEVRDHAAGEEEEVGGASDDEEEEGEGPASSAGSSATAKLASLTEFVEHGFRSLTEQVARLEARVGEMEASARPDSGRGGREQGNHTRSMSGEGRLAPGVLGQRIVSHARKQVRPSVPAEAVESFLRANLTCPAFQKVRNAKVRSLASAHGVDPPVGDVPVSAWTTSGLLSLLNPSGEE